MKLHQRIRLTLIRHGEVDESFKKICYGKMDVPLSERGRWASLELASEIAKSETPIRIIHSGLARTHFLAETLAANFASASVQPEMDTRLQERDYGRWQGQTWDAVYESDPEHFHDLIEDPDNYRPPGGETTSEMQVRIQSWYNSLCEELTSSPNKKSVIDVIAISHSGPIAALAGGLLGLHPRDWGEWMLPNLGRLQVTPNDPTQIIRILPKV